MEHAYDRVKKCRFRTPLSSRSREPLSELALVYVLTLAVDPSVDLHGSQNSPALVIFQRGEPLCLYFDMRRHQ
jgi:hypothetical protein